MGVSTEKREKIMKRFILTIVALTIFCGNAAYADLAKSGTISWVTGWVFNMTPLEGQSEDWSLGVGECCWIYV